MVVAWIVVLWVVAGVTSSYGAVNERELRRRRYDLEALGQLSSRLEQRADAEAVASTLVDAVTDDFGFGRVLMFGGPRGTPRAAARRRGPVLRARASAASGPVLDAAVRSNRPDPALQAAPR